jgi:hypothetical protein
MSLYWMTAPIPGNLGDWHSAEEVLSNPSLAPAREFFSRQIIPAPEMASNQRFMAEARRNIRSHPGVFIMNIFYNAGRLFLGYPYSDTPLGTKALLIMVLNGFFITVALGIAACCMARRPKLPPAFAWLAAFSLVACGGFLLLSAYLRFFTVLFPPLFMVTSAAGYRCYKEMR